MSRSADSARGSSKLKEQLYKYDPNFKYYDRIQTTIKEKRGCQVCCVGSLSESKYFGSISRRLCTFCFDDMTISMSKIKISHKCLYNTDFNLSRPAENAIFEIKR